MKTGYIEKCVNSQSVALVIALLAMSFLIPVNAQPGPTPGRLTKWFDDQGTLVDSVIQESDNGNIGVGTDDPNAKLHVVGPAAISGTGMISSSGITVTGNGTAFTAELHAGDVLVAQGQSRIVKAIASPTSLTIEWPFLPAVQNTPFTFQQPIARFADAIGSSQLVFNTLNNYVVSYTTGRQEFTVNGRLTARLETGGGAGGGAVLAYIHSIDPSRFTDPTRDLAPVLASTGIQARVGEQPVNNTWTGYDFDSTTASSGFIGARIAAQFPRLGSGSAETNLLFLTRTESEELREKMRIDSAGNVGIGTSNPRSKLDVAGPVHATQYFTDSDVRLKEDITPLTGMLDKLDKIRGISFKWNTRAGALGHPTGGREIGVIAQEVEAAFPEVVAPDGKDGYKAVDYGRLTAVLIEAVKELKAENAALKHRIEMLESK